MFGRCESDFKIVSTLLFAKGSCQSITLIARFTEALSERGKEDGALGNNSMSFLDFRDIS